MQSFLDRWRFLYLLLITGLTAFFGYHCLHLGVDEDNRSMDAENESYSQVESEFKKHFGGRDSILFAVHRDQGILDETGQALIREMAEELGQLNGVNKIASLADTDFVFADYLEGLLISKDRRTTGIRIELENFSDNGKSLTRIIQGIRQIAKDYSTEEIRIAITGLPLQKHEAGRLVRKDQRVFAPLSFFILGCVLLLITKKWSGMVFPMLVSALTICWTLGIYSFFGYSLNMITSLLAPVIMTLSVTTTIHIYLEWLTGSERNNQNRVVTAVKNLYRPCLFASLTTAIGFLSLCLSNTPAVRQFGMFAALGVVVSYIIGVSGLAVGLSFLKAPALPDGEEHSGILSRMLDGISNFSIRHPKKIILGTLIVAGISFCGLQKVRVNTDLLRFLGEDTILFSDTMYIDSHLTGVNMVDLLISKSDEKAIVGFDEVKEIEVFQDEINRLPFVKHTLSLVDLLDVPEVQQVKDVAPFDDIIEELNPDEYFSKGKDLLRLSVRTEAIGSHSGAGLIDKIRDVAAETLGTKYQIREVGGFYRVIAESNQLVSTQLKSFGIAILLILIAIGMVFRSFQFMGLAIIPNVIPLLMTAAIMGFFKIDLSTGTTMIASVVIGVAVDDTIHYLAAFQRANKGDYNQAVRKTTRLTGFALLSTTLALSFGFWVAMFGSFQPTIYFALLSGLTMWFALICDLLVLPACLRLVFSRRKLKQS